MKFTELNLNENLFKGINEANFIECTEVQEKTLKFTLENQDVYAQSQTGTGKTAAFLITIFQMFAENPSYKGKQALIIVPTRELAVQIEEETNFLGKYMNLKVGSFYGGVGYKKQEALLKSGVDIMIGTPGRLVDLNKSGTLNLKNIGIMVIDEADRLFDMGFLPDLRKIFRNLPSKEERLTLLFSATLNFRVRHLAWEYMNEPEEIEVAPETITVDRIEQRLYHVEGKEKMSLLLGILKTEKPETTIIFTNTKYEAERLSRRLVINGYENEFIIGDLPQKKRLQIIDAMKNDKIRLLIATDVAARGLNVEDLDLVINYDIPEDCDNYVHRIGRTGRAGKTGMAISLACEKYVYGLEAIESRLQTSIPVEWAEDELLEEDKSKGEKIYITRYDDKKKKNDRSRGTKPRKGESTNSRRKKPSHSGGKKPYSRDNQDRKDKRENKFSNDKKRKSARKPVHHKNSKGSYKKDDLQSRVEYYKKKYGDNFKVTAEMLKEEKMQKKKKSVFKKIFGFFGKSK